MLHTETLACDFSQPAMCGYTIDTGFDGVLAWEVDSWPSETATVEDNNAYHNVSIGELTCTTILLFYGISVYQQ